jgi:hypothetical protein
MAEKFLDISSISLIGSFKARSSLSASGINAIWCPLRITIIASPSFYLVTGSLSATSMNSIFSFISHLPLCLTSAGFRLLAIEHKLFIC